MPNIVRRSGRRSIRGTLALLASATFLAASAPAIGTVAWAQAQPAAAPADAQPKQVTLTQKSIDSLITAQKQIRDVESKAPQDQQTPDPKLEAKILGIIKASGFATMGDFADTSYSVGIVIAGLDPESGTYIGTQASLKKQMSEVQADAKMAPKEKKEALDELTAAIKDAPGDKPLPGNVDVVKANVSKLNEGQQGD